MKITLELSDETVWALLELSGSESLEEALDVAIAGFIRLERESRLRQLMDSMPDADTGEGPVS